VTSVAAAPLRASWVEPPLTLIRRTAALSLVELQKLRHDHTELLTRTVQPLLWLLVFGQIFSRIRAIPTGPVSYLAYLTPGILAQSRCSSRSSSASRSSGTATPGSSPR
jgi:ABC-2 type transport system permease protein